MMSKNCIAQTSSLLNLRSREKPFMIKYQAKRSFRASRNDFTMAFDCRENTDTNVKLKVSVNLSRDSCARMFLYLGLVGLDYSPKHLHHARVRSDVSRDVRFPAARTIGTDGYQLKSDRSGVINGP